jgi:two-component system, cell cycle sensor histidine kinase and response regulator CckA
MSTPLRVLFIGQTGAGAVLTELSSGGYKPGCETVTAPEELRKALASGWDVAIALSVVGELSALKALALIQEKHVDLPLIVVTGRIKDADVVAVLKAGAADHITRPNLMRLNAAVEREVRAARLRRERNRLEEQFRQAQKMEAVGRLAGGVAHDFNNLLTVITGYSDLLLARRDRLQEAHCIALEEIRRSAERGGALTNQLLAFSRRQPLENRAVHLNELVMQLEKMLRRLVGEDIEMVTIPAASQDLVEADPGRLEQVIMNLAVNSRDAMPDGGKLTIETGTVHLGEEFATTHLGVHPGAYATISVIDTGAGMDEDTKSHIFEPFFTTKGHGTGLGLASAYGIIRQSGGAIGVISDPGLGTTMRIYLPIVQREVPQRTQRAAPNERLDGAETILLVEDEARVRKLIVDVLTARGYAVLEATRGEEALRLCRHYRRKIDLSVIDVVMPEMSGPDLVRQLRPLKPKMRVLYISGYTDEAIVHHGILRSGAAFLQKPFVPDMLARKVREVLDGSRHDGSSSAPKS